MKRLVAPAFSRLARAVPDVGVAGCIVAGSALVLARLLGVFPWTEPAYDLWAYWSTNDGLDYGILRPGDTGAYLYSPAFAQAITPLTALPWTVFAGLWTALQVAALIWLGGRWALLLLIVPPVLVSVIGGQLDLAFAIVALAGLRWPVLWAFPILTKVTPGVGLIWFAARRDWRSLAVAAAATALIAGVSFAAAPDAWRAWVAFLAASSFPELDGRLWFLPVPLAIRLPAVVALVAWGARTDRRWVLPVGMCLAVPTVFVNTPAILVGLLPLAAAGARTPAGAWLRGPAPAATLARLRRRFAIRRRALRPRLAAASAALVRTAESRPAVRLVLGWVRPRATRQTSR